MYRYKGSTSLLTGNFCPAENLSKHFIKNTSCISQICDPNYRITSLEYTPQDEKKKITPMKEKKGKKRYTNAYSSVYIHIYIYIDRFHLGQKELQFVRRLVYQIAKHKILK